MIHDFFCLYKVKHLFNIICKEKQERRKSAQDIEDKEKERSDREKDFEDHFTFIIEELVIRFVPSELQIDKEISQDTNISTRDISTPLICRFALSFLAFRP